MLHSVARLVSAAVRNRKVIQIVHLDKFQFVLDKLYFRCYHLFTHQLVG